MSIKLMTLVWEVPFPTSTQMVIALKLADHADDDGHKIYPGRASLAARARCSESSVKNILRMFREAGILVVIEEGGKGPHDTTVYALNVALLQAIVDGEVAIDGNSTELVLSCGKDVGEKGAKFDPLEFYPVNRLPVRGQRVVAKGSTHSPQTIKNHQEPSGAVERATRGAARPALKKAIRVTDRDASWGPWLDTIEDEKGAEARKTAERIGELVCEARWPAPGVPLPVWPEA
jgi:predicted hydrocarbon binding protein